MDSSLLGLWFLFGIGAGLLVLGGTAALIHGLMHPARITPGIAIARGLATEPDELGLRGTEMVFRLSDGKTSPGWIIEGDRDDGPSVVFTHGWGGSRFGGLARAPFLARFSSRVVIYDVRGHGDSSARKTELATKEVQDLTHIIEQGCGDKEKIVLFGSSMGAGATLVAAASSRSANQGSASALDRLVGVIMEGPYRRSLEPVIGQLREWRVPPYPFVWLTWVYLYFRFPAYRRYDRVRHAERLDCPLLVLHGTEDQICPIESAQQIASAAPLGQFVPIEGGVHGNLASVDEERYIEALTDWFNELDKPAAAPNHSAGPNQKSHEVAV